MVLIKSDESLIINKINGKRKAGKNFIERARFLLFWSTLVHFAKYEKSSAFYYFDEKEKEKKMYLKCSVCFVYKEATHDNYTANNVSRAGDIEKWFVVDPKFKVHSFFLGTHGCNQCWAHQLGIRDNDTVGVGYIIHIMCQYLKLHRLLTKDEIDKIKAEYKIANNGKTKKNVEETDRGLGWFEQHRNIPCWATGFITVIVKKGHPFMLSPNDTVLQSKDINYNRANSHELVDVVGVRVFSNIRQRSTNIPNLQNAFISLYNMIVADFFKTIEQRSADEDAAILTLASPIPQTIMDVANHSKKEDTKKGREWDMTTSALVKKLTDLRMRCHTTGVVMSVESGPFKVHGDRIINKIGHLINTNVELKCALFSARQRLTRKQFLHGFLEQQLVALPDGLRAQLQAEYEANPENIEDCDESHEDDADADDDADDDKKRKRDD